MSSTIHPTVIIDETAQVDPSASIGPYSIIGPHCIVGESTKIGAHVVLEGYTQIGSHCEISSGAILGGKPQDLKFKEVPSYVRVGDYSQIREFATIHRSTQEGQATTFGERSMLMAYSHIAHDCTVGDEVIIANNAQLAGHVVIEKGVFLGGATCVHQGVRIGRFAILGGVSATRQDVPPFAIADGRPASVIGINKVALKRRGFTLESRSRLKQAFQILWASDLNYKHAIELIRNTITLDENIEDLICFIENSKRGVHRYQTGKKREHVISEAVIEL